MHKDKSLNVISSLVPIAKKLNSVSRLLDATPSTGSLTRLIERDNQQLWHTPLSPTSARAWLTVLMLVLLPVSIQGMAKIKKERIFIGLTSIPVLTVVFVSRFAPWLMQSFLKRGQIYKYLADA